MFLSFLSPSGIALEFTHLECLSARFVRECTLQTFLRIPTTLQVC